MRLLAIRYWPFVSSTTERVKPSEVFLYFFRILQSTPIRFIRNSMRAQRLIVSICLIVFGFIESQASTSDSTVKSRFGFGVGSSLWLQPSDYAFSPHRFSGELSGFTAIPVDEFVSQPFKPTLQLLNLSIAGIWSRPVNKKEVLELEFGLGQCAIHGSNGDRLRYTDMIIENSGFVLASRYKLDYYNASWQFLYTRPKILFQSQFFGGGRSVGLGVFSYFVVNSSYRLSLTRASDDQSFFYKANDINIKDVIVQVAPELYMVQPLAQIASRQLDLRICYATKASQFVQISKESSTATDLRPIVSVMIALK